MYMRCSCQDDEVLITDYCDSCHANTVEIENGVNMWATSHMWFLIKYQDFIWNISRWSHKVPSCLLSEAGWSFAAMMKRTNTKPCPLFQCRIVNSSRSEDQDLIMINCFFIIIILIYIKGLHNYWRIYAYEHG